MAWLRKAEAHPQFVKDWNRLVDQIFARAADEYGWYWQDLAREAGLSYSTVYKIGERQTVFPHFYTVWRLARAVGWEVTITAGKVRRKAA